MKHCTERIRANDMGIYLRMDSLVEMYEEKKVYNHLDRWREKSQRMPRRKECEIKRKLMQKRKKEYIHWVAIKQNLFFTIHFRRSLPMIIYEDTLILTGK